MSVNPISFDKLTLQESVSVIDSMPDHLGTKLKVERAMHRWLTGNRDLSPLVSIQNIMESIRRLPRSDERVRRMVTLIRNLGHPNTLANFIDAVLHAADGSGTRSDILSQLSQKSKMHCIYGWAGQTMLIRTHQGASGGTSIHQPNLSKKLNYATPAWSLSIHIWQLHKNVKFLPQQNREKKDIIEPPHSHPFDFVSMVSKGEMKQSIYEVDADYSDTKLQGTVGDFVQNCEMVDGVWPPHEFRETVGLRKVESQLRLKEGQAYFHPYSKIHDVEFDKVLSENTPAITLFLASESMCSPVSFISSELADYHDSNPNLITRAEALGFNEWKEKLQATASYLRGESQSLKVSEIVNCPTNYAFIK